MDVPIPTQSDPVPVKSVFGWIMIHQHLGYTFDWLLPWADYKAGFGSTAADYWLGLEKIHLLTSSQPYRLRVEIEDRSTDLWYSAEYSSQPYRLRVEIEDRSTNLWYSASQPYRLRVEIEDRSTNLWYSAEYWSFSIGDELNDKYRLDVSGYSGDAGDSLRWADDYGGNGCFGCYLHNGMKFTTYDSDNDPSTTGNCASQKSGGWWFNSCFMACLMCSQSYYDWYAGVINSRMMIKPQ